MILLFFLPLIVFGLHGYWLLTPPGAGGTSVTLRCVNVGKKDTLGAAC
jgi:hypothetical protein